MATATPTDREPAGALGPGRRAIERAGANDLMQMAVDAGPVPMQVAGVLLLDAGPHLDLDAARALVGRRAARVPRLRQRLVRTPPGCGRPVWVDDPGFDARRHVHVTRCAAPGDEAALLDTTLAEATRPLPRTQPLWSATFVTGLADGAVALVVVLHHVVADGVGALAVLGALVDPAGGPGTAHDPAPGPAGSAPLQRDPFPRDAPPWRELAADAWAGRLRSILRVGAGLRRVRAALSELGVTRPSTAPRCSLNRPTGRRRRAVVVHANLAAVAATGHRSGGTVNDVVLTAVGGALGAVLRSRGEQVDTLVVSVPVSGRKSAGTAELGNRVGVMPVEVATGGDPVARLAAVARATRAHKGATPGASAALLQPAFRLLAVFGAIHWLVDRQRLVNTFVTNLRGPTSPMSLAGRPVRQAIVLPGMAGNVTAAFAVLSYAGTLAVTVLVDPDGVADLPLLERALHDELLALTGVGEGAEQPVASAVSDGGHDSSLTPWSDPPG